MQSEGPNNLMTTGKDWMPVGPALITLSTGINKSMRQTPRRSSFNFMNITHTDQLSPTDT